MKINIEPNLWIAFIGIAVILSGSAAAQPVQPAAPATSQPNPAVNDDAGYQAMSLWPNIPPGSEDWNWSEITRVTRAGRFVHNVVKPMILIMPADPNVATGTGIVVAPGGGFHQESWDAEGVNIAKQLNAFGLTAFVLKYRLNRVAVNENGEAQYNGANPVLVNPTSARGAATGTQRTGARALAIEDARQAMQVIRDHAVEWKLDPNRIGFLGFSAGGMTGLDLTLTSEPAVRPNFLALVYGSIGQYPEVPKDSPPLFLVATTPDATGAGRGAASMATAWLAAGRSVELHLYAKGAHAFAFETNQPRATTLPAHGWISRFRDWLDNEGWLKPATGAPNSSR